MPHKIIEKEELSGANKRFRIEAPLVAMSAKPGQFVIIRIDESGERIPLTIADSDEKTITLVFQEVGATTIRMGKMKAGDSLEDLVGPLGRPSEIENFGTVVCVAGGVGIAPMHPIAKALKSAGNKVISIIGARSKNLLFWEDKIRSVSGETIVMTDDGSHGRKGVVTILLKELLDKGGIDRVIAIGPPIMMKFCAATTLPYKVKTIVSLNPIMVDGTGMCGACRCLVGGKTKFACVDGPDFDAHQVDYDLLMARLKMYQEKEKQAMDASGNVPKKA
ncbi:MAG: ferredoxin-NADP reductase [Thermoplasmata archaeon HGW-Thermoplasmata-2]|nr:MAG: ferredoxin-NADP reductase [Thermoplasmata archaeon HGW-Thermoplasmata-2]